MKGLLNIALRAAREGAARLAQHADRLDRVERLADRLGQPVSSAHLDVEQTVHYHLQKTYPGHHFTSTASGPLDDNQAETTWLIDPLAGGENFLRGIPGFLTGIACRVDGQIVLSVYIDPLLNEEFSALRGDGARRNGRRMRVGDQVTLQDSIICVEASDDPRRLAIQDRLLASGAQIRCTGCALVAMLYCASGRFDGGFAAKPNPDSLAAAALIVRESGVLLSDSRGDPACNGNTLVFGNAKCFKQLLKLSA